MATDKEVFKRFGVEYNPEGYGVGGISGVKLPDVTGWDNVTVGLATSIYQDVIMMNGVSSNDPNAIPNLEPLRAGRFIVKWLKIPAFFDPKVIPFLTTFLEKYVRGITGIPDNTLSVITGAPVGVTQREIDYPGIYKENGKTFTLNTITCTGDGLGKLIKYWMYGMSDRSTGVAHMYGKNMRFTKPNYSGSLIYIFLGPTCRPKDIEFACMWHECFPTSSDGDSKFNNPQMGEVGSLTEQEVEFSGIYDATPIVSVLAQYIVAAAGLYGQSQFDQVLPAYLYDLFTTGSTSDEELKYAMNLNLRDQIDKTIKDKANSYTPYTDAIVNRHDELATEKGISGAAIRNAITFEDQMNEVRQSIDTEVGLK